MTEFLRCTKLLSLQCTWDPYMNMKQVFHIDFLHCILAINVIFCLQLGQIHVSTQFILLINDYDLKPSWYKKKLIAQIINEQHHKKKIFVVPTPKVRKKTMIPFQSFNSLLCDTEQCAQDNLKTIQSCKLRFAAASWITTENLEYLLLVLIKVSTGLEKYDYCILITSLNRQLKPKVTTSQGDQTDNKIMIMSRFQENNAICMKIGYFREFSPFNFLHATGWISCCWNRVCFLREDFIKLNFKTYQ